MNDSLKKLGGSTALTGMIPGEQGTSPVREKPRASVASHEIHVDASLLNPPNKRLELAFEVRAGLRRALSSPRKNNAVIAEALEKGGAINEPLLALIDRLFPSALRVDPKEAVEKIRALPAAELETRLATPATARPDAVFAMAKKDKKSAAIVDRGRAILAKLAASTDPAELAFLAQIRGSSASLGRLAEALDTKTPAAFLAKIRAASPQRVLELLGFLETDRVFRKAMQATVQKDSWSSDQAAERTAVVLSSAFHKDHDAALEAARRDLSEASAALAATGMQDAEKWLYAGSHVIDGGTTHSRDLPYSAKDRVPYAIEQHLEQKVRELGEKLFQKSFGIRGLDVLFEMPDSPRAKQLFASTILEFYGSVRRDDESRTQYLSRLLRDAPIDQAREALIRDYHAHSAALLAELGELKAVLVDVEATEREVERTTSHLRRELDSGVLRLPQSAKKAIEQHMVASYPKEGCGYLVCDGHAMRFFPIENEATDSRTHAVQNQADLDRMNAFLKSSGWFVLGQVHSHPGMSALFSPGDLEEMKVSVALAPGRRSIIVGVDGATKKTELCSFQSGIDGQVIGEDRIDVAR